MVEETQTEETQTEETQETETQKTETQETEQNKDSQESNKDEKDSSEEGSLLGEKNESKESEEKQQAPEKYDFTIPEGMELDTELIEKSTPIFKELNLNQEQAQKLVDLYSEQVKIQADKYMEISKGWKKNTIKELGNDYQKELSVASKFIDTYGSDEVRQVLNDTGLGNHTAIVKMFIKAGKAFSDDNFSEGDKKNRITDPELQARKMFPNTKFD